MSKIIEVAKTALNAGLTVAKTAVIQAAMTAVPLLRAPVISHLFKWVVGWVVKKLHPHLETLMTDLIYGAQVSAEKKAYEKARDELKQVLEKTVRNQKEVEDASKEFDDRLERLIRFRP